VAPSNLPEPANLRQAWAEYIIGLPNITGAPFEYWGTLTYQDHAEIPRGHVEDIVARRFRYFTGEINKRIYGKRWIRSGKGVWGAIATEKLLDYPHHHFIMGGDGLRTNLRRLDLMDMWEKISSMWSKEKVGGWARCQDYRGEAGARYIVKYVGKGGQVDVFAGSQLRDRLKLKA